MGKVGLGMSVPEIILTMSELNVGAMGIVRAILEDPMKIGVVLWLDSYDIRGVRLWNLFKDCCGQDFDKFYKTIDMLRRGAYTKDEIWKNLDLPTSLPFFSDSIKESDYAKDSEELEPFSDEWNAYIQAQRALVTPRLEELHQRYGKRQ